LNAGALLQLAERDWLNWSHNKDCMDWIGGSSLPYNLKL